MWTNWHVTSDQLVAWLKTYLPDPSPYAGMCPDHARALTNWREKNTHESDEEHAERVEHHRTQCRACLGIAEATGLGRELP